MKRKNCERCNTSEFGPNLQGHFQVFEVSPGHYIFIGQNGALMLFEGGRD
jgi:hypothetical protein